MKAPVEGNGEAEGHDRHLQEGEVGGEGTRENVNSNGISDISGGKKRSRTASCESKVGAGSGVKKVKIGDGESIFLVLGVRLTSMR